MPGTREWELSYCDGTETIDLGLVNTDWITQFSQRHFDAGAEFLPGPQTNLLVLQRTAAGIPTRFYVLRVPNNKEINNG